MILQTENQFDRQQYSASVVQTNKRVTARYEGGGNELVAALSQRIGPFHFDVRHEAAVWRGAMRATNPLRPPFLVVGVDDALKKMTLDEFGASIRRILEGSSLTKLATDGDFENLLGPGFTALRTRRLHLLSLRRIPILLFMAKGHDRPFSCDISPDSSCKARQQ